MASELILLSPPPVVPTIEDGDSFAEISKKLASFIIGAVDSVLSWEDLRSSKHLKALQPLIDYLARDCQNVAVVAALVALKGHFTAIETDDDCGVNEARGFACELVAWQFVLTLSEQDALDFLLFELHDESHHDLDDQDDEETGLLSGRRRNGGAISNGGASRVNGNKPSANGHNNSNNKSSNGEGFAEPFMNLNTLEIAAVSGAKKFLSQRAIQDIVTAIWKGEIVFWDSLTVHAVKKPRYYNKKKNHNVDPWCRLRVPRYMKTFEIIFFVCFLALFYIVSLQRVKESVTAWELLFYVFVVGFAFDEVDDFVESGASFYQTDIWAIWDIGIVVVGLLFFVLRMVGLATGHDHTMEWAFNILALHSLLLTPRIFSLLSLSPYYGSLLPCLKEMGKQFIRFLGFVLIIYVGFFSTFILLARGHFPLDTLSITVLKVFFGAGVVGFDIASQVSPHLGLPVMIIFVCLTNQLLITSMMAHISNSLRQVLDSSREEYLYVYSVYVLEAVTSDKLTYFQPPFNLIPIILLRPLLWVVNKPTAEKIRILLLKATHAPFIAVIWGWERWDLLASKREAASRAALSFGFGATAASTTNKKTAEPPKPIKAAAADVVGSTTTNKKHTLKKTVGRVQVPALLVSQASKRPAKYAGGVLSSQEAGKRVVSSGSAAAAAAAAPVVSSAGESSGGAAVVTVGAGGAVQAAMNTGDVVEMMRMLKELSAQVEEVRAALVKHDKGPSE